MSKLEAIFQRDLVKELEGLFPGCMIFLNDPLERQGIPDLLILHNDRWAMLECKAHALAAHQPNQDWYIEKINGMSYAAFIYPENKEEVLREVQQALGA